MFDHHDDEVREWAGRWVDMLGQIERQNRVLVHIHHTLDRLEQAMSANQDQLTAIAASVTAVTAELGTLSGEITNAVAPDDFSGLNAAVAGLQAAVASLTAVVVPPVAAPAPALDGNGNPIA